MFGPFVLRFWSSFRSRLFQSSVYRPDSTLFVDIFCSLSIFRHKGTWGPVFRGIESTFRVFGPLYSRREENDMLPVEWWNKKKNVGALNCSVKKDLSVLFGNAMKRGPGKSTFCSLYWGMKGVGVTNGKGLLESKLMKFIVLAFCEMPSTSFTKQVRASCKKPKIFLAKMGI